MEECHTEASIGVQYSESVRTSSLENAEISNSASVKAAGQAEGSSPSGNRKRKRISPHSTPKVAEGFGDSKAGELLKKIPELEDSFTIVSKVGEGTFSNVYLAKLNCIPDVLCALKHIIPTSGPSRIENELKCLQDIGGTENVIGVQTTLRCSDHVVFVLPYFPHQKFQEYFLDMSVCEIKEYMRNLFVALQRVHSFQVIHRDVKPSNFLYCRETGKYRLVDFGLAMKVPGSANSLLDSPKEFTKKQKRSGHQSPQRANLPRRRSSRLSPQNENKDHVSNSASVKEANTKESGNKPVLKPHSANSGNHQSIYHPKAFKIPSKIASTKLRKISNENDDECFHQAKVLCPLRHGPREVCTICMARAHQNTPRAGTPGFRSPEVLLKYPHQSTAVDIWSAGVIFLCILSGRYPFFRAYDDLTSLAQIMCLHGSKVAARAAFKLGKDLTFSSDNLPGNLKVLCSKLRGNACKSPTVNCCVRNSKSEETEQHDSSSKRMKRNPRSTRKRSSEDDVTASPRAAVTSPRLHQRCLICRKRNLISCESVPSRHFETSETILSDRPDARKDVHLDGTECTCSRHTCCWTVDDAAYDLLERCLDLNPHTRITASEALDHPFLKNEESSPRSRRYEYTAS